MRTLMALSFAAVTLTASTTTWAAEPFRKTLELQGFSFVVEATNDGSINQLKITPTGGVVGLRGPALRVAGRGAARIGPPRARYRVGSGTG